METRSCLNCGKSFVTKTAPSRVGRGKYCSRSCQVSASHRGQPKPASRRNLARAREVKRETNWSPPNKKEPVVLTCQFCSVLFSVIPARADTAKYCSRECSNAYKRTVRGANHPLYVPTTPMQCEMCGKEVAVKPSLVSRFRFCSRRCTGAWVNKQWPRTSSIEKRLHDELTSRGVSFLIEHAIGPFVVDIAFPASMLAVEADGDYWHGRPQQQSKDRQKDGYLSRNGWRILRLTESEINADVKECVDRIITLLTGPALQ